MDKRGVFTVHPWVLHLIFTDIFHKVVTKKRLNNNVQPLLLNLYAAQTMPGLLSF